MKSIFKILTVAGCLIITGYFQPAKAMSVKLPEVYDLPGYLLEMKVSEFIKMQSGNFSKMTGKKLNLKEKVSFSLLKKEMKKALRSNPDQTVNEYLVTASKTKKSDWIILIIFIGLCIVLVILASLPMFG